MRRSSLSEHRLTELIREFTRHHSVALEQGHTSTAATYQRVLELFAEDLRMLREHPAYERNLL